MSTDTQERTTFRAKHLDLTSVTLKHSHNFDGKLRHLELVLTQSTPDDDADPFENLVLPLTILLVEEEEYEGGKDVHEDQYSFTLDGDLIGHCYRNSHRGSNGKRIFEYSGFKNDSDISKLYRYGEVIQTMMQSKSLGRILDEHPTVKRMKAHELWKYPS